MQITHNEAVTALTCGGALLSMFTGWWMRGPRSKSLDRAYNDGYSDAETAHRVYEADAEDVPRPDERPEGSEVAGPGRQHPDCLSDEFHERYCEPGRYPDGREYPTEPGGTVNPELAALAAQIDAGGPDGTSPAPPGPPEAVSVRLDETTEQWAARMRAKAAIWCAENGIDREMELL